MTSGAFIALDRDGTVIVERNYLSSIDQVEILPGVPAALNAFRDDGFSLIIVTNQSGIARGYFDERRLEAIHGRMLEMLAREGVEIDGIFYCPHHPDERCSCRKPEVGMIEQAARRLGLKPEISWMVGDKKCDIDLARRAGMGAVLVKTGYGATESARPDLRADFISENLRAAHAMIAAHPRSLPAGP